MDYSNYEGKIILVTGGAGCVGSNLSRKLSEFGWKSYNIRQLYLSLRMEYSTSRKYSFCQR